MLQIINSSTERTTAATDVILGVLAIAGMLYLAQLRAVDSWKANIWIWAFGMLALASILGAIAHGFEMSDKVRAMLWHPLYLSLGLLVALFVVATAYDIWGLKMARWLLPVMIIVGIGFFGVTLKWPDSFSVFIVYEAVAMLFALIGYLWLAINGGLAGAWLMVIGILATMVAAAIQAKKLLAFTFIWPFDHNGVYHLIQMIGVIFLVLGLRLAFDF